MLSLLADDKSFADQTERVVQGQFKVLLLSPCDCRERLKVRGFILDQVVVCSTNPLDAVNH